MSLPDPEALSTSLESLRAASPGSAAPYIEETLESVSTPSQPGLGGAAERPEMSLDELAALIDHTHLRPAATDLEIDELCDEASTYGFASACVHPAFVPRIAEALETSSVSICTVVGFPHGANRTVTKAQEAERAVVDGARELDMVLSLGAVTSGRFSDAEADIRGVVTAARDTEAAVKGAVTVKVILETALLSVSQIAVACVLARRAGADYVKTSTGFASAGARAENVALMRQIVGTELGVKASGGIGTVEDVQRMVAHGATRIGASGSVAIMEQARAAA